MFTFRLSDKELYELNDAVSETIHRMVHEGQTPTEAEEQSLAVLWEILQKIHMAGFGTTLTPGLQSIRPAVEAAIANPRPLGREHAYLGPT